MTKPPTTLARTGLLWGAVILLAAAPSQAESRDGASAGIDDPAALELRPALSREEQELLARFRTFWHQRRPVFKSTFLGIETLQNPMDAWILQEIMTEVRPDYVVEAGTYRGGSALLWALLLGQINPQGRVVTIDLHDQRHPLAKRHPIARQRVEFLHGSSTDPEVVRQVGERVAGKRTLFILDSLHTEEHVAAELAAYAPLVTVGSYVVVQDTLMGAIKAVDAFVAGDDRFVVDHSRERFLITNGVRGYVKRVR